MHIRTFWPVLVSAAASILLHAVHMAAAITAAGAASLHAHAGHAHGHAAGAPGWMAWLGWGLNVLTLVLAACLFISYLRLRRDNRRKAASHLTVCLVSFTIVAVTLTFFMLV